MLYHKAGLLPLYSLIQQITCLIITTVIHCTCTALFSICKDTLHEKYIKTDTDTRHLHETRLTKHRQNEGSHHRAGEMKASNRDVISNFYQIMCLVSPWNGFRVSTEAWELILNLRDSTRRLTESRLKRISGGESLINNVYFFNRWERRSEGSVLNRPGCLNKSIPD